MIDYKYMKDYNYIKAAFNEILSRTENTENRMKSCINEIELLKKENERLKKELLQKNEQIQEFINSKENTKNEEIIIKNNEVEVKAKEKKSLEPLVNIETKKLSRIEVLELVENFQGKDFVELYKEAKSLGVIKDKDKRYFEDVLVRINLKQKLVSTTVDIMVDIYLKIQRCKEELEKEKNFEKNPLEIFKELNLNEIQQVYKRGMDLKIITEEEVYHFQDYISAIKFRKMPNSLCFEKVFNAYNKIVIFDEEKVVTEKITIEKEEKITEIRESVEEEKFTFESLVEKGLKNGVIEIGEISKVNFEKEEYVSDIYEAIEELEDRGIQIKY